MHDSNIDISHNNNHKAQNNIMALYEMYFDFLHEHNLIIMNKKFTRFTTHQSPNYLDNIVTNFPASVSDVSIKVNLV